MPSDAQARIVSAPRERRRLSPAGQPSSWLPAARPGDGPRQRPGSPPAFIPKSSAMKNTSLSLTFDVDSAQWARSTQFLITGGTGFIGRHVAYRLLDRGATVRVFCRAPEKARRLFGNRVEISRGDLCDRASVAAAVRGCRVVIHLGATFQFGREARRVAEETNVRGTEYLLEAAEQNGIERFVYVSSSGVLEGGPGLLTEHDFPSSCPAPRALPPLEMARRTRRTRGSATRPSGDDCQSDMPARGRRRSPNAHGAHGARFSARAVPIQRARGIEFCSRWRSGRRHPGRGRPRTNW